jgi:NTP pyrophosphatase (non-canonical NTP hydrolase)
MTFQEMQNRAMTIRDKYAALETKLYGKEWSNEEIALGLVGDVGDLMKLVVAKEGMRQMDNVDEKIAHELSDCLWVLLVLSKKYGIDLETAFTRTMDTLEQRI